MLFSLITWINMYYELYYESFYPDLWNTLGVTPFVYIAINVFSVIFREEKYILFSFLPPRVRNPERAVKTCWTLFFADKVLHTRRFSLKNTWKVYNLHIHEHEHKSLYLVNRVLQASNVSFTELLTSSATLKLYLNNLFFVDVFDSSIPC